MAKARPRRDFQTEYRPCAPYFVPTNEPWADYYRTLHPGYVRPRNPWSAWKYSTTAVTITEALWAAREHAREWWESSPEIGIFRVLTHPPVVLWFPQVAHSACIGCTWIHDASISIGRAAECARIHSITMGDEPPFVESFDPPVFRMDGIWE